MAATQYTLVVFHFDTFEELERMSIKREMENEREGNMKTIYDTIGRHNSSPHHRTTHINANIRLIVTNTSIILLVPLFMLASFPNERRKRRN